MLFPSGLHAGESSEPGLVVSRRSVWPRSVLSAATIQRSLLRLLSGSSVRLLLNTTSFPSGDHAASPSSKSPEVIWRIFVVATPKPGKLQDNIGDKSDDRNHCEGNHRNPH